MCTWLSENAQRNNFLTVHENGRKEKEAMPYKKQFFYLLVCAKIVFAP